jgi:hypothetical protein
VSVALHFPDGTVLRASTASDVLAIWDHLQWTPVKDPDRVKAALSERAWQWSATAIDPSLPDDEFLTALEGAGLCAVSWSGEKAKPGVWRPPLGERDPGA